MGSRLSAAVVVLFLLHILPAWAQDAPDPTEASQGGKTRARSAEDAVRPAPDAGAVPDDLTPAAISDQPVAAFTGTVHARVSGDPIAGATVTLMWQGPGSSTAPWPSAVTGAQGTFVVTGIEPGYYQVLAVARGYRTHTSMIDYNFSVEVPPVRPIRLGRPGLRSSLDHLGAIRVWPASLLAMALVLALARRRWLRLPTPAVRAVVRAMVGIGVGPIVGLAATLIVNTIISAVSTAGPAVPNGALVWARHSGYGAIAFTGVGVGPLLGLVTGFSTRVATAPARAAALAGCGGLAAGLSMCRTFVTYEWLHYMGFIGIISCPGRVGPTYLTHTHMLVVCLASAVVGSVVGLSVSLVIQGLGSRRQDPAF